MANGSKSSAGKRKTSTSKPTSRSGKAPSTDESSVEINASKVSQGLQQQCLDIFRDALKPSVDDLSILQEVKRHLYNRDFETAFGKPEYLQAYASRWSPSRALGYLQIFEDVTDQLDLHTAEEPVDGSGREFNAVCLGGGAGGELVALAGWLRLLLDQSCTDSPEHLHISLLDIADWSQVTGVLRSSIVIPPKLSKYASQARKDANEALLKTNRLVVNFHQQDVLEMDDRSVEDLVKTADLVTIMFTLNELYSSSMPKTQTLLSRLKKSMRPGSLILVVDSPGSYSTVSISGSEKKYPMQWMLDLALRGPLPKDQDDAAVANWERLMTDESRWFRLPENREYPIELENMRYQIHLYRRKAESGD